MNGKRAKTSGYVFYLLMRNDLASMNPGKACAQSTHAAHAQVAALLRLPPSKRRVWEKAFLAWSKETRQGFGTAVAKAAPIEEIRAAVKEAKKRGMLADLVLDPEYPLKDGASMHKLPLHTCAFMFTQRADARACPVLGPMLPMD